jgi:site-specific DNA-methyltransferase (adenine-specific)
MPLEIAYQDEWITLYKGDVREVLPQLTEPVNMVLTDPPYPKEYDWCWDLLGKHSERLLMDTGSFVSLCSHYQVPKVTTDVGKYLRYWWLGGMLHTNRQRLMGIWVDLTWKPAVWFVKRTRRVDTLHFLPRDMFKGEVPRKDHPWQQPVNWFVHWAEALTKEGELILDPFAGTGTTLIAAKMKKRKAIGIEQDPKMIDLFLERVRYDPKEGDLCHLFGTEPARVESIHDSLNQAKP